jgi:hypothetical protein
VNEYATLGAVERILDRGGDADDLLRATVAALHEQLALSWAGISFVDQGRLVLGPSAGEPGLEATRFPIRYEDQQVAELGVSSPELSAEEAALLERVASLLGPYCLVGWDTGGEAWSP